MLPAWDPSTDVAVGDAVAVAGAVAADLGTRKC